MKKLEPKVILITGASSGMGKHTALDLIKQGHVVYGAARSIDKMQPLVDVGGHAIQMDVMDAADTQKVVDQIIAEQGRIDVLWNNAGYGLYGPVELVPTEKAKRQFDVNLFGLSQLTQIVVPHMRDAKKGLIINTSSMGGKIYFPLGSWYHATKHALEGWSDCLRLELKSFGINVVVLEPGAIDTNFYEVFQKHFQSLPTGTAYQPMIDAYTNMNPDDFKASPPSVISKTVQKIIHAKKPKTRYLVGKMAKPMVFIRKWFGDRVFDRMVMGMFK